MANYYAKWIHTATRPSLFGVIDASAGIPLVIIPLNPTSQILWLIAFLTIVFLTLAKYFGYTPMACLLTARRFIGKLLTGGVRSSAQPFESTIKRIR